MKHRTAVRSTGLLIVILALTILSCSGLSDISTLFATETPTPTLTYTPSPTLTPSATPTPTLTPTQTPVPTGVRSEKQTDGSILVSDYDNAYQLTVSEDWVFIPFDQDQLGELVNDVSKDNPQFREAAANFKNLDPDVFRFVALNKNKDYFINGASPNINIVALGDPLLVSMPLAFVTGALEESFKQNGTKVVSEGVNILDNSNGVEIEYIDVEQSINGMKIAQRLIVFQTGKKLIMITLTSPESIKTDVFASGDKIAASIKLLK